MCAPVAWMFLALLVLHQSSSDASEIFGHPCIRQRFPGMKKRYVVDLRAAEAQDGSYSTLCRERASPLVAEPPTALSALAGSIMGLLDN